MSETNNTNDKFLPVSIIVAAVMISGSVLFASMRGPAAPTGPAAGGNVPPGQAQQQQQQGDVSSLLALGERDVILGDPNAPVTIIEYSDFQCPFCERFYTQTEPLLKENYIRNGKVRMVYRHLAFLGPESLSAAEASECAKDQGKFWAFHDALFVAEGADGAEHNGNLARDLFVQLADEVGMDVTAFGECYDSGKYAEVVQQETSAGQAVGINATPTFLVNDQVFQGAQPYPSFKQLIDGILAEGS